MVNSNSTQQGTVTRRGRPTESPSDDDPSMQKTKQDNIAASPGKVKTPHSLWMQQLMIGGLVVFVAIIFVFRNRLDPKDTYESQQKSPIIPLPPIDYTKRGDVLWKPRILQRNKWKPEDAHRSHRDQPPTRRIKVSEAAQEAQENILDSDEYSKKAEPMYTTDPPCEPQYEWMTKVNPVCNNLHEIDMTDMILSSGHNNRGDDAEKFRFIANGGYRDVYMFRDHNWDKLALKTLRSSREFQDRHYDRHRRDAVAADRLTAVPTSVDIYGFCGQSALYQFARGGNLRDAIDKHIIRAYNNPELAWNSAKKLQVAHMVAQSIADLHNVDQEGRASIAHTDISTDQFISIQGDGYYQLNDFNRARFLRRNTDNPDLNCPFTVKSNKGKFRSPEEYLYHPETEAVDTYSMGNIFFVLLTGTYPFPENDKKQVKKLVGAGERPNFGRRFLSSTDPNEQALIEAAKLCWVQDPKERASARQVQLFLESKLSGI